MLKLLPIGIGSFFFLFLAVGCATIEAPKGGNKDTESPKVKGVSVANGTTQFKGQSLSFVFDEYFSLQKPQQTVLISPPLENMPEFEVKGKTLTVLWEDTLKENTTYNFFFAKTIKDVNEGNDTSFSWVVSTGNHIDSLGLLIKAQEAFTGDPASKIWIAGYKDVDPLVVSKRRPDFLAQTNEQGIGELSFLPEGPLQLFALKDNNGNLIYEAGVDEIGFLNAAINAGEIERQDLQMFAEEDTTVRILEKKYLHPGRIRYVFNKDVDLGLFSENAPAQQKNDTAEVVLLDAQVRKGNYTDTYWLSGQLDSSTFYIAQDLEETRFKIELLNGSTIDHDGDIVVKLPRHADTWDLNKIALFKDSIALPFTIQQYETSPSHLHIKAELNPEESYTIQFKQNAIQCFFKMKSDSVSYTLRTRPGDYYGQLLVQGSFKGKIIELVKEDKVIRHVEDPSQSHQFVHLAPGKYTLRMIDDLDGNGEWTSGELSTGRQPEQVHYYPELIDLRSGWDQEVIWDLK